MRESLESKPTSKVYQDRQSTHVACSECNMNNMMGHLPSLSLLAQIWFNACLMPGASLLVCDDFLCRLDIFDIPVILIKFLKSLISQYEHLNAKLLKMELDSQ